MRRISIISCAGVFLFIFIIFSECQLSGAEYKYNSKGRRDPFIPLITGQSAMSLGLESVVAVEDIEFEGVILDPSGKSMAVLNGEIVKEGDKAYNVELVKISGNAIIIKLYNNIYTIHLTEEGGETIER